MGNVRWKLKSDKSFFSFLSRGGARKFLPLLVFGVLLFILGSWISSPDEAEEGVAEMSAEESLAEACSMVDGVGRCRVMVTENSEGEICAVVVLCDGAESAAVRKNLTELISSLYGIRSSRIAVVKME